MLEYLGAHVVGLATLGRDRDAMPLGYAGKLYIVQQDVDDPRRTDPFSLGIHLQVKGNFSLESRPRLFCRSDGMEYENHVTLAHDTNNFVSDSRSGQKLAAIALHVETFVLEQYIEGSD